MIYTNGSVDLHLHTNRSDGYYSPIELINKVIPLGLKAIAIVDHDEISAFPEAIRYGQSRGLEVLPGVELSVDFHQQDIHILGYCFDYENPTLVDYLNLFKNERIKRAEKIVQKLSDLGMPISFDAVLQKAGRGSIGRPHVANVLIEKGFVYSFQEAFNKYLGEGKPANVEKYKIDIHVAFELIESAGGVCSIAHPGLQLSDDDLMSLIKSGVQGIEVVHPKHDEEQTHYYSYVAQMNGLLETGGSDFHGGQKGEEALGKFRVPYDIVLRMKDLSSYYNN